MQVTSCESPPRGSRMSRSTTSHTPTSPGGGGRGVLRRESAVEVNDEVDRTGLSGCSKALDDIYDSTEISNVDLSRRPCSGCG